MTLNGNPNPSDEFGVSVSPTSSVTIADLAFTSSSVYNAGTLTLINSTISGNTAIIYPSFSTTSPSADSPDGGGIFNQEGGTLTLISSTVSGNYAETSGGGIWNGMTNSASQLVMRNSIVAENKAPAGPDILGNLTSQGYNLIQNTQDMTFAPNQEHETDLLQVAPSDLGVDTQLRDNKGATQTHALLPGSVAIDRIPLSDCRIKDISTDQRGVRRSQGVECDIGAYEWMK